MNKKSIVLTLIFIFPMRALADMAIFVGTQIPISERAELEDKSIYKLSPKNGYNLSISFYKKEDVQAFVSLSFSDGRLAGGRDVSERAMDYGVKFSNELSEALRYEISPHLSMGTVYDKDGASRLVSWNGAGVKVGLVTRITRSISTSFNYRYAAGLAAYQYSSQAFTIEIGAFF